jgi:hypothetical protein
VLCFKDADCAAGGKCNKPLPLEFGLRQPPTLAGIFRNHSTFVVDGLGRKVINDQTLPDYAERWKTAKTPNRPVDLVLQECFGGGFPKPADPATLASAAAWYEPANNKQFDAFGGCSDDATRKCLADGDCAAGATCTNPKVVPSPLPGGCSNFPQARCLRDLDCQGSCTAGLVGNGCAEDTDCGVCSNDAKRGCFTNQDCRKGTCNQPAAGSCSRTATCTAPRPGSGMCGNLLEFKVGLRCLQDSACESGKRCRKTGKTCQANANCGAGDICAQPNPGECVAAGPGRCSNDATRLCLEDTVCLGGGRCTNPAPKPLVRGLDNFTRAWRQSANDPNRLASGFLDHFGAAASGVNASIAPDPFSRTDLPYCPEHPQYRSLDGAANGANDARTLRSPDPNDNTKLYAILAAWGRPEPRHEANIARVYNTLLVRYGVPSTHIVLLYGNLPSGTRIGNYPARADGQPALLGGLSPDAANDDSVVNPNDAQGFLVDGPTNRRTLTYAMQGGYYPANDQPGATDRLLLYFTGHGGHAFGVLSPAKKGGLPDTTKAEYLLAIQKDCQSGLAAIQAALVPPELNQPDMSVLLEIATRGPFDLTTYPDLALKIDAESGAEYDLGRFADHPEWLISSEGITDEWPGTVPHSFTTYYQIGIPVGYLTDDDPGAENATIVLDGVNDAFFSVNKVTGIYLTAGEIGIWNILPEDYVSLRFMNSSTMTWAPPRIDTTVYDVAYKRSAGGFDGDFSGFSAAACGVTTTTFAASGAGNPPVGSLDLWLVRARTNTGVTAESWDEGGSQLETRDDPPTGVPPDVCP